MSLAITLDDDLAERLAEQAGDRKLSVEQWALAILEHATTHTNGASAWSRLNSRRLALICKSCTTGLSPGEEAELSRLQDAAARVCEPQDRKLLEQLDAWEKVANRLSPPTDE